GERQDGERQGVQLQEGRLGRDHLRHHERLHVVRLRGGKAHCRTRRDQWRVRSLEKPAGADHRACRRLYDEPYLVWLPELSQQYFWRLPKAGDWSSSFSLFERTGGPGQAKA